MLIMCRYTIPYHTIPYHTTLYIIYMYFVYAFTNFQYFSYMYTFHMFRVMSYANTKLSIHSYICKYLVIHSYYVSDSIHIYNVMHVIYSYSALLHLCVCSLSFHVLLLQHNWYECHCSLCRWPHITMNKS